MADGPCGEIDYLRNLRGRVNEWAKRAYLPQAAPYLDMRGETGSRNLRSNYPKAIPWDTQWFAE